MFNICGHWQFCKKYLSFDLILLLIWRDNGSDGTTRVRLGTKIMQELKFRIWYWSAYLNQVSLFPDTYVLNLKIYQIEHFQTWSPHLGSWQLEQRIKTNNFHFLFERLRVQTYFFPKEESRSIFAILTKMASKTRKVHSSSIERSRVGGNSRIN